MEGGEKSFRWLTEPRRARCRRSLTVGAQGGRQHLNALVPDGVPGGEVGGQRTPGGHGAGWGGGAFGGVGFGLPVTEETVFVLLITRPYHLILSATLLNR